MLWYLFLKFFARCEFHTFIFLFALEQLSLSHEEEEFRAPRAYMIRAAASSSSPSPLLAVRFIDDARGGKSTTSRRVHRGGGGGGRIRFDYCDDSSLSKSRSRGLGKKGNASSSARLRLRALRAAAAASAASSEDDLFASLEPPSIDLDLESMQEDLGAVLDDDGFVLRYNKDGCEEEMKILRNECAIIDRSQWGVFRVASGGGGDMRRFLETMASSSSNDSGTGSITMEEIEKIQPGTGKRLNGRLDIYAQESGAFLVIVSREDVKEKKVETVAKECGISEVMNLASRCVLLTVCGPKTLEVLKPTGLAMVLEAGKEYENAHAVFGFANRPVVCCKTNEFLGKCGEESAVNFVVDEGVAGQVWAAIIKAGAIPVGSEALDAVLG